MSDPIQPPVSTSPGSDSHRPASDGQKKTGHLKCKTCYHKDDFWDNNVPKAECLNEESPYYGSEIDEERDYCRFYEPQRPDGEVMINEVGHKSSGGESKSFTFATPDLIAPVKELVKVKDLEWTQEDESYYTSDYSVYKYYDRWRINVFNERQVFTDSYPTLEAAQLVCQEHYENRIYQLLEPR